MATIFANFFRSIDTPDHLAAGFMVQSREVETLYALQDGKVYCAADLPRPNVAFDEKGRIWVECDSIPLKAEFIGNYEHIQPAPTRKLTEKQAQLCADVENEISADLAAWMRGKFEAGLTIGEVIDMMGKALAMHHPD